MKIDAHGPMGEAGALGDFWASHAFDEAKDESFAIGFRERKDGIESGVGFGTRVRSGVARRRGGDFFADGFFGKFVVRFAAAVKVGGAVASNGREPAGKFGNLAKSVEARKGLEKNVLDEVVHVGVSNAGEENAVDHAGVAGIEKAEGGTVALLGGAHEGVVRAGVHGEPAEEWGAHFKLCSHGGDGACLSG
jgi:hypothetical protein